MAAGATFEPISTQTVSGTPSSITLSPPSTYTDLKIVIWHSSSFADDLNLRFNSDASLAYRYQSFTAAYSSANSGTQLYVPFGAGSGGYYDIDILNYNSTSYRAVQIRSITSSNYPCVTTGLWENTSAITSILLRIGTSGSTFPNGTVITVFGIAAA